VKRLALFCFFVFLIGSGLSELYWVTGVWDWISILARIGFLFAALMLFTIHVRYWSEKHDSSFVINPSTDLVTGAFFALSDAEAKSDFEDAYRSVDARFTLGNPDNFDRLTKQLVAPRSFRRRVHEHVEIVDQEICHNITYHLPISNLGRTSDEACLVAVTRFEKQSPYEQLSIRDDGGALVEIVNYRHALGMLYELIRTQIRAGPHIANLDECKVLTEVAGLLASPVANPTRVQSIYTEVTGEMAEPNASSPPPNALLWGMVTLASERRPVIAVVMKPKGPELVITLRYQERLQRQLVELPEKMRGDAWRRWGNKIRTWLGFMPAQLFLEAKKARSALTYRLTFTAPSGAYIHEARPYAKDQQKWVPSELDRHGYYNSFVGWTNPRGRSQSSMGCRLLNKTNITDLSFYVRLCERPPGTAGNAFVIALAVMIIVWLSGFVATVKNPGNNVDIVALTLAFPGVIAVWLSLSGPPQLGPYRSIPARISMVVSAVVSVCAIVLYMAVTSQKLTDPTWWGGRSFFFLTGRYWSILLIIAIVNFVGIAAALLISWRRYRKRTAQPKVQ
jgi:hypothetical protein